MRPVAPGSIYVGPVRTSTWAQRGRSSMGEHGHPEGEPMDLAAVIAAVALGFIQDASLIE